MMKKESIVFYRLIALAIGTFLFSGIAVWILQANGLTESIPLHAVLETSGSIIALFFALFIFKFDNNKYYLSRFHFVSIALIAIAVIGLFHAMSLPGSMFVWLHTIGMFVGSILIFGVFIPERRVSAFFYIALPVSAVTLSVVIALILLNQGEKLPAAIINGHFSESESAINNLSALFFFFASIRFAYHYRQKHQNEDIYFFVLALLLSGAAFLFQYSQLWGATWWYWHFMRLSGFFFVLLYFIRLIEEKNKLFVSREIQSGAIEFSADAIITKSLSGIIQTWNTASENLFGYTADEAIGRSVSILYLPSSESKENDNIAQIKDGASFKQYETVFMTKNGSYVNASVTLSPIKDSNNTIIGLSKIVRDITEHEKSQRELRKLSQAIEQSPNSVIITDNEANIEYVNAAFTAATGYSLDEVIGKNPRLLQSGKTLPSAYSDLWNQLKQGKSWHGEFMNQRKDGTQFIEEVKIAPIFQADGSISHYMAMKDDITEKKHIEERIHYLANYDLLTGLPNRSQFIERITYFINVAKRQNSEFAIMFLDLDHFKDINDTLGHSIGDALLVELAKRIQECMRNEDTVSRLGGDEFIFMLPNTTTQGIVTVAEKLLENITKPFSAEHNELIVTASIGIAIYPIDGTDPETLSKNADTAMYQAKLNGRNNFRFFTKVMQKSLERNIQLTNALRHALEKDQLHVVYQPQVAITDAHIIGAEALLRWNHPELGAISPLEFISIAEENGLILPIGEWVLRSAVKQAKEWIDRGFAPMIVAVNLSAVQFRHSHLPELVTKILEEFGLPSEYLELELTEAVTMHDPKSAFAVMDNLHERGIRMSIDDFGTGYSSLSYLKKFKVYKLKIDQSFIRDITTDSEDKAIVNAIISMAHSLGLQVIAEGVETIEQLDYLREEGCDEIQGYYFSKPLSAESFNTFIAAQLKK
ncbi:MAG TPA: GGDEF domain-containing protein [Sulfuricurvum sp.]|nr:GGDEF domain-containing protein [Sulfuricurvum sp.]